MTYILYGIFILTAIFVIIFDIRVQKIPILLLIINYISLCVIANYWLLFGLLIIILAKIWNKPIDILYVFILCYLIIIQSTYKLSIIAILIVLCQVIFSKDENKISFMLSLELAIMYELILMEVFTC